MASLAISTKTHGLAAWAAAVLPLSPVSNGLRFSFGDSGTLVTAPIQLGSKLRMMSPRASKRLPDQLGGSDALLRGRNRGAGISHRLIRRAASKF